MTEAEEMEALKRAYAEMILNTTKEAAVRVMEAELRARRMEQAMNRTKQEAAGLLLRLKQMIDENAKEAKVTSLNQLLKCDELESQLNEAEGIIIDLRAELDQAEDQLYKLKNERMLQNGENSEEPNVYSGDDSPILDQINEPESNPSKNSDMETANAVIEGNDEQVKNEDGSIVRRSQRKRKLKFWDEVMAACGKQSYQLKKPRKSISCLFGTKTESPEVSKELVDSEALIECDVAKKPRRYVLSRKWNKRKKKSMVYNMKRKKKSVVYPENGS